MQLLGNIEFPQEARHCLEHGAEGVGLYRTEFFYLDKTDRPDRGRTPRSLPDGGADDGANRPVVIRTLDLGADKFCRRLAERRRRSAIRSWDCAAFGCVCGI